MYVLNNANRQIAAWRTKPKGAKGGSLVWVLPKETKAVPEHAQAKVRELMSTGGPLHGDFLEVAAPPAAKTPEDGEPQPTPAKYRGNKPRGRSGGADT